MIRSVLPVLAFLGFAATYIAVPSESAGARAYRGHAANAGHTRRAHRKIVRKKSKAKAPAAAKETAATPNITLGEPPPPKRPEKLLTRAEILESDPARLERLGRRLMVGFESFAEVRTLVEKRAVAGIFITDHNVRGRKAADIAKDIRDLQDIRKAQGLPRLLVAADQEGGYVSRLSPPLKLQPSLGTLVGKLKKGEDLETAVRDYAETQGQELERLGVTMNFGPVVDLRLGPASRKDGETRLYWRAISADPYVVADVAGWYCDTLTKYNIICTLKHFPGLGRVPRDTHVDAADVTAKEAQLELTDWVPFRRLMGQPGVATMVGHVRVKAIDGTTPASFSDTVINSVLRPSDKKDALLVTDDFSMGAVTKSPEGLGGAVVKAVNAGIDLVLISYTQRHYDVAMSALIEADTKGEINEARQIEARERMAKYAFVENEFETASPQHAQQQR
ncbi:glycoside hydrolase [Hyphomicrobium methylovorum]|uniref:glycoside hydrolase family 3 protein n=1 Tax=Hyphomicrobium methylovorum TaxID=84 RepID=UPI0015E70B5D|nr:glycoside hydrolase family 3 protein [Hyphomicrobium methylovorum]MBA2125542.1 glycoside hydrolase [Hyphomicrobium methylovorum]